ncbi:calcium-binding protein LPS1-alpha-like [Camellia sinensis]|uniref:calcium-binding protein LPS1-alpha-like n=1 Tax=Camellia sinensis TaxID=4442 RepID=UPI0010355557|nr:calcium-binding protein LPS1-alpha-like [Camellia sinensis]
MSNTPSSCHPRLFVADLALGVSLCLQGLWVLQTGLSLSVAVFIPEGCHKLLDVVRGVDVSTKCDLDDSKLRAVAILDLMFVLHNGQQPHAISRSSSLNSRAHIEEELKQVFNKFDVNGDGKISSSELGSILSSLGYSATDDELQTMIREVDSDGDGVIDLDEFIELNTKDIDSNEVFENLKEAFSVFDIDKNGSISADELQNVLSSITQEKWRPKHHSRKSTSLCGPLGINLSLYPSFSCDPHSHTPTGEASQELERDGVAGTVGRRDI